MPEVDPLQIALVGQQAVGLVAGPPPIRGQGPVVSCADAALEDVGIVEGIVEVEAKVRVKAPVQLIAALPVGAVQDAPVPGEPLRLLQQEGEVGPLSQLRAASGVAIPSFFQAAPHDHIEVQAVQLQPLPEPGLRQALAGVRDGVRALPDLLRPEVQQLRHQGLELVLAELLLLVRGQPPEGPVPTLHVAQELVCYLLETPQVFVIVLQLFLN